MSYSVVFAFSLFGFFHMNLVLFRGEIFTVYSTDLFCPKCMVNPTLTSVAMKSLLTFKKLTLKKTPNI